MAMHCLVINMIDSLLKIKDINAYLRNFLLALFVAWILNAVRLYFVGHIEVAYGQGLMLLIMFFATYYLTPQKIVASLCVMAVVSMCWGYISFKQESNAGSFLPVLGLLLVYFYSLQNVLVTLILSFVATSSIVLIVNYEDISSTDIASIIFKLFILHLTASFTALFSYKFSLNFMSTIQDERSLRRKFETEANIDTLTNVFSRRGIFRELENLNYPSYTLVMVDIDFFKSINDLYGHACGDKYLKAFADRLKSILPKDFLLGRIGGEEFLIIAPHANSQVIKFLMAKILSEIGSLVIEYEGDNISRTCSLGVCVMHDSKKLKASLRFADEALYQAKLNGRNRCEWYTN